LKNSVLKNKTQLLLILLLHIFLYIVLGNLCQLGILSLRDNKLQYLPNEVGNCVELHVLDVSGNK